MAITNFLGPVDGSVKGSLNKKEVARSSILGTFSWATVWVILTVIWQVAHMTLSVGIDIFQAIITDPNVVAMSKEIIQYLSEKNYLAFFVGIGTFILDAVRRKYLHGQ